MIRGSRDIDALAVPPGRRLSLQRDHDPSSTGSWRDEEHAAERPKADLRLLAEQQGKLWTQDRLALLLVFQGMDAAGKNGVIKHLMAGINPLACQVSSFRAPTAEELDHDYLWRHCRALPERGRIGIFNRSWYEEVLAVRVHPELLARQRLPPGERGAGLWKRRLGEINAFERYLADNGILVLKFFLNVSREEQRRRFLKRIERPEKRWKFTLDDVHKRSFWKDYMRAYEDALSHTSTSWAPWYVVPADHKWYTRHAVCSVVLRHLQELNLRYPRLTTAQRRDLRRARNQLLREG